MAICFKCSRVLSANGSCLYCGTSAGAESVEDRTRSGRRVNWLRRILIIALVALLGHFFFITAPGRGLVRQLLDATGLSKYVSI